MYEEKTCRVWLNAEITERATCRREHVLKQFWQSFVDDRLDRGNAIQTKAEFSSAIAVIDKIGGWKEENRVGSRFAASMWICTEAVICKDQNNMQDYKLQDFRSIMEADPSWKQ